MNYLGKMRSYPQFSFVILMTLVKIYISYIIINRGKNTFESVGTVLKLVTDLEVLPTLVVDHLRNHFTIIFKVGQRVVFLVKTIRTYIV